MLTMKSLAVAFATTAILGSCAAFAAEKPNAASSVNADQPGAAAQNTNMEFAKLSADGRKAFQDVRLARLAIFDGRTDQAKKYVDEAYASGQHPGQARRSSAALRRQPLWTVGSPSNSTGAGRRLC